MPIIRVSARSILFAAFVLFAGASGIWTNRLAAQGATATVLGTVVDTSGASIAEATVVVTNVGTGLTQSVETDTLGRYQVPNLGIGDYQVQASKSGFAPILRKGITLTVGGQIVVDFSLMVGTQTQAVTVEAQVVQVETTSSTVASLIDPKQMRDLPLNGRNFEQLIQLAPGVNVIAVAPNARQGNIAELDFSGAGARPEGQAILFDDEDIQNVYKRGIGTVTGSSLGVEATAEFQTLTNTYSAQFGGNGIVINAVSKSGTNNFHGSAYEFLRNSALDARNFFDKVSVPSFRKNQFGGTLGGPLKKDKIFFFANYEGVRQALGQSAIATVPDATHRSPAASVTNPTTATAIVNTMALYPLPTFNLNAAAGTGQITEVATQAASENYLLARLDYNISAQDSVFLRYFLDRQHIISPFASSNVPLWPEEDNGHSDFFTAEWKRILSNTMINTARFSFSRPGVTSVEASTATPTPALQFFPADSGRTVGTVAISGLTGLGLTTFAPSSQVQNRFTGAEDFLWTRGAHSLRFGTSVVRMDTNVYYPFRNGTTWSFTSLSNFLAGTANSLQGVPVGPQFSPYRQYREIDFAFYTQDDWKATSKLTLNLGLRYMPQTNPIDAHNALFMLTDFAHATGFVNVPHITQTNPNWSNLDPRIGFAYDLFADHKTALRGGFAINHDPIFPGFYTSAVSTSPPWNNFQQNNAIYPIVSGLAASLPTASPGWNYFNNNTPYVIQYNLNIQRQITQRTVMSAGYVGSHGVHLQTAQELNPPAATIDANGVYHFASLQTVNGKLTLVSNPRLNPALSVFSDSVGATTSQYHSLQASLNRQFNGIVQAQLSYTYSHCIDNGNISQGNLNSGNASGSYENPYNPKSDRGSCFFDVRHALRVNGVVALPFHGNKFVEGWQITGITSASSGSPFSVTDGFDQVGYQGSGTPRPNVTAGCNQQSHTVNQWFNTACFPLQAAGTLGNVGRNTLVGPKLVDVDMSVTKDTSVTKISEAFHIQFRAEIFNILNHPNFGLPAVGIYTAGAVAGTGNLSSTAGQITTTVTTSRQIQFGLKFIF